MRYFRMIAVTLLIWGFCFSDAHSQESSTQPSLAATAEFIMAHANGRWGEGGTTLVQVASMSGDMCTLRTIKHTEYNGYDSDQESYAIAAKGLDLQGVEVGSMTPNGGMTYGMVMLKSRGASEAKLYTESKALGQRLANALRTWGRLCGAKDEAF